MQIMLKIGEERQKTKGLNIVDGNVKKIKINEKLPIIGWHKLSVQEEKYMNLNNKYFYFIHSYECVPKDQRLILAYYNYFSKKIVAVIKKKNFIGTQFHPEKSGNPGLVFLKKIISKN